MPEDVRQDVASRTTDLPAYKMGKALIDGARTVARNYTAEYHQDVRFALGETQWPNPASFRAWYGNRWKSQTVRNYTFATIHHKMAVCLDAEPAIRTEPMDELSTYKQRQDISSVVAHELDRLRWNEYARRVMFDGSICGTGLTHFYVTKDNFSNMHSIHMEHVDPRRFYPDPSSESLYESRYIVYEPEMDMSDIRKFFPDTYQLVKPTPRSIGKLGEATYNRTTDELIRGEATGEIAITSDGTIQTRVANVCFIWIKDPTVVEDLQTVLERAPASGFKCNDCGQEFDRDSAIFTMDSPKPRCPTCEGENLESIILPPEFAYQIEKSMKYQYGRLIAMTDNALLSDGESQTHLDMVFPFAGYSHYPIAGRFWGHGEVAQVRRVQEALNKHIAQGLDYMRLAGSSPLEVPAEVPAYRHLGNMPGDVIPCPAPFMGLARPLAPGGYNVQMHQILDQSLKRDMQEITGVSDVSQGISPSAPTSGVEVQARQRAASTRVGLHLKDLNQYRSDAANITYQLMHQFYTEPRAFTRTKVNGELESIVMECSTLPREVRVKVSASLDKIEKDKLFGQNLMMAVDKGQLGFYADLMLPMLGADQEIAREIQQREVVRMQEMQAAQMAQAGQAGMPGQEPVAAATPSTGSEQAYAAEGV